MRTMKSTKRNYKRHCLESCLFLVILLFNLNFSITISSKKIYLKTTAFVIGLLYSQVKPNTQESVQDITGALFTLITESVFTFGYFVVYLIPEQMPLLRREVGEELYSLSAFYVSKVVTLVSGFKIVKNIISS